MVSTRSAAAVLAPLIVTGLLSQGAAQFFGVGIAGFKTVSVPQVQTIGIPIGKQLVYTTVSLPFSSLPLAPGLSLTGTTAYVKTTPAPSTDCLETSLQLFIKCQPFLETLVNNGGQLTKITVLQLLQTAQNKTSTAMCVQTTLNFMNQGCVCDAMTYNTLESAPTTTIPQLVKSTVSLLAKLMCPRGLINSGPSTPDTPTGESAATDTSTTSDTSMVLPAPTTTSVSALPMLGVSG